MRCTGNDPRRALGSAPDPLMRSRHQLVESSGKDAQRPEGKENRDDKSGGEKKKKKGRLTLWSSLNVPTCTRVMILCVLQAICPESKTRGETAAPWRPDARRKQLCQQRRGWLRACADYRLPPPGFANNEAEHHRAAQPTTCRAPRLAADKQVRSVFTL